MTTIMSLYFSIFIVSLLVAAPFKVQASSCHSINICELHNFIPPPFAILLIIISVRAIPNMP